MNKAALSVGLTILLMSTAAAAIGPVREVPAPNIHFLNNKGGIQKGVRCATTHVNKKAGASGGQVTSLQELSCPTAPISRNIPVVFHVIYKQGKRGRQEGNVPIEDIEEQVWVLNNKAFQGTGFSFTLAGVNRVKNAKWFTGCYGIETERQMKQALAVDPATTLNIYTCKPTSGILGYAYLPWAPDDENNILHGVVVLYSSLPGGTAVPYNEGDTVTHEVGHYLGLYHTFEGGCTAPGDYVGDTPAEASPAFGCPEAPPRNTCPTEPGDDPIYNFMDYTDDPCMDEFTSGQGDRVQCAVYDYKSGLRCGDGNCDAEEDSCVCPGDGCPPLETLVEVNCTDKLDNDCDFLFDGDDPDCAVGACEPVGESCGSDADCCSNKCKGKRGGIKACR